MPPTVARSQRGNFTLGAANNFCMFAFCEHQLLFLFSANFVLLPPFWAAGFYVSVSWRRINFSTLVAVNDQGFGRDQAGRGAWYGVLVSPFVLRAVQFALFRYNVAPGGCPVV